MHNWMSCRVPVVGLCSELSLMIPSALAPQQIAGIR